MGIYVKFWHFYDVRSLNMAMSRDPRSKFQKRIYFFLILHLILGKVTKFLVERLSTSDVISQNLTGGGVENTPRSAFRVKEQSYSIRASKWYPNERNLVHGHETPTI